MGEILPCRKCPSRCAQLANFSTFKTYTAMSKLLDYLNHLDKNADARDAHVADAAAAMTNFGLSQDEQDAVASGSKQKIAEACGVPATQLSVIHIPNTDITY